MKYSAKLCLAGLPLLAISLAAQNNTVVLKRAFVEKYKDRATIDVGLVVDHAHKTPNAPVKDGDLHVAGRAPKEVGLPMVAEVMNAAQSGEAPTVADIHRVEGRGVQVPVTGAWRLWFEHPARQQIQFAAVPVAANTNPAHSFEIHPITQFDGKDVTGSFVPVAGSKPYDAQTAFGEYEKLMATVSATASAISISASKANYNYTEFDMTLEGKPKELGDGGYAVLADVDGEGDESAAYGIRMIFVPGTPPLQQLLAKNLRQGDRMHVIGIPRVNLNAISTAVQASEGQPVIGKLPYEMIIVAAAK